MIIDAEIAKLVSREVLQVINCVSDGFISNIFIHPKKNGAFRMILNLKPLNKFVFLMFQWKGKYYHLTCLPNGLSSAPRIFTKILKPVYARLCSVGHTCMGHIDDSLLVGHGHSCHRNVSDTVCLVTNLGFTIHPVKSVLQPQQKIDFLSFVLDSITMTVTLTDAKAMKVRSACENLLLQKPATICSVTQVIGFLVSSFHAVGFAEMHYRYLELDKICALHSNKGNFDSIMSLSAQSKTELTWWVNNVLTASKPITHHHSNYRCLNCGLGSCLWRNLHRGILES